MANCCTPILKLVALAIPVTDADTAVLSDDTTDKLFQPLSNDSLDAASVSVDTSDLTCE